MLAQEANEWRHLVFQSQLKGNTCTLLPPFLPQIQPKAHFNNELTELDEQQQDTRDSQDRQLLIYCRYSGVN